MKSIRQILNERKETRGKFSKHEFQVYGYRLAEQLGDLRHKSLYMKLAKEEDRQLLEKAMDFVKDSHPRNKGKLFMWKLKELRKEVNKGGD